MFRTRSMERPLLHALLWNFVSISDGRNVLLKETSPPIAFIPSDWFTYAKFGSHLLPREEDSALGQYRLNLMAFSKDFNARTQKYKPETPMAVTITAFTDNTFEFTMRSPSHVTASTITLKHVYEIAKLKQRDPYCQYMSLESISKSIIRTANSMGIMVQKEFN
ncbi:54S ribosomal protein L19, mitochondrial [Sesamum alatum]|uniref:54S ribosomal protein L19, mitochondrial n=1 Tax=Sesamum alatum TaxID=300844 RepID=A0AAE1Y8K4_9LAMI|nr:54S ribosomal protein L19, mitochondrial [Sesamum alatum]